MHVFSYVNYVINARFNIMIRYGKVVIIFYLTSIQKTCNKIFSALGNKQKLRNCKDKIISAKGILGPLALRHPWRQVVPNYSQYQDVLQDKKVA